MMSVSCVLFLALLPSVVTSTATSAEIFPKLHLRHMAAAVQKQITAPVLPADEPEATGDVPAPVDAGSDGFPHLPAVSQMLNEASGTVKNVNSGASDLEARVVKAQMQIEGKLAKEKAAFEEKLKQQEANNRMIINENANITAEINRLQGSNTDIKTHAHEVEEHSRLMRSQLHLLQSRLGVAKSFTAKSITNTDDSKSALLDVLHGGAHHHGHPALIQAALNETKGADDEDDEDDTDTADTSDKSSKDDKDDDDEDEDDDKGISLMSFSTKVSHKSSDEPASEADSSEFADSLPVASSSSTEDLLTVLSQQVTHLAQQEKESTKKLKALFVAAFKAGAQRRQKLLAEQKALNTSRSSLLALQTELKTAEAHLETTRAHLQVRLHGLGQFIQKLAHFAMAPQSEVPHLLEVLPKAVTMSDKK